MANISECPTADLLQQWLLGLGDPSDGETWERHLTDCPRCLELASKLQAEDDLVRAVRRTGAGAETPQEEIAGTLISLFRRLGVRGSDETGSWAGDGGEPSPTDQLLAAPQSKEEIGRLGSYVFHSILGAGGMGVVYRGFDPDLRRAVAVKVIRPELLKADGMKERFIREARAAAAVEHDHIVVVYAVEVFDGVPCITMPLLHGETLKDRLGRLPGPLAVSELLRIGREIASGLTAAHARGLIHRDIKPGNLWLEKPSGRIKILDFGLAMTADSQGESSLFAGTPGFMSPEQARGKPVDARSDLFSLGCVLYQAATGKTPFPADSPAGKIIRTVTSPPPSAAGLNRHLPPKLTRLIDRLLANRPGDRPESAKGVHSELVAIEAEETARLRRRQWLAGVATAAVLGGAGAWGFFRAVETPKQPPVEIAFTADADVGMLILTRDGIEQKLDPAKEKTLALAPGDYNVRAAEPVAGREVTPGTFIVLPKEPKTIRLALVGEMARTKAHTGAVTGVAVLPGKDRSTVLSASLDRTLGAWEPGTAEQPRFTKLDSPAVCLSAAADGSLVATAGGNKSEPFDLDIHLFDARTLARKGKPLAGHERRVSAVAISEDGNLLISASLGDVRLWDVPAGTHRPLEGHGERAKVSAVAFDPARKRALTGDDEGFVIFWDIAEAKVIRKLIAQSVGSSGGVIAVAFTPEGFVSAGDDGVIRLWDRETFKPRDWPALAKPMRALAVSADGKRLLSGGEDGLVRLWSLPDGRMIREFAGHGKPVRGVAFTPDGRGAVSGGEDNSVRLWRLPFE